MQNIIVNRYDPPLIGWAGSISPADHSWTLFIPEDGSTPSLYLCTGEKVSGPSPEEVVERRTYKPASSQSG